MLDYSECGPEGEPAVSNVDEDRVPRRVAPSFDEFPEHSGRSRPSSRRTRPASRPGCSARWCGLPQPLAFCAHATFTHPQQDYGPGMAMGRWHVLAGCYVGAVAMLAARAFSEPQASFTWSREGLATLLTLPALVLALPVVYFVGALSWNLTNADSGGPMWPVTLVYTLMFAGIAIANVWIFHLLLRSRRRRRSAVRGRQVSPESAAAESDRTP